MHSSLRTKKLHSLVPAAGSLTSTEGKPTALAATKESSAPKKSTDVTPKLAETEAPAVPATEASAPVAARTGSSSSSSADEEKRKKAAKSKSRSVSRGKRASIFGGFLGKKEKTEEKKEEDAEVKKEYERGYKLLLDFFHKHV